MTDGFKADLDAMLAEIRAAGHLPSSSAPTNPVEIRTFVQFALNYLLQRASGFTKGNEREEGFWALQDAKKFYDLSVRLQEHRERSQMTATELRAKQAEAALATNMSQRILDDVNKSFLQIMEGKHVKTKP